MGSDPDEDHVFLIKSYFNIHNIGTLSSLASPSVCARASGVAVRTPRLMAACVMMTVYACCGCIAVDTITHSTCDAAATFSCGATLDDIAVVDGEFRYFEVQQHNSDIITLDLTEV